MSAEIAKACDSEQNREVASALDRRRHQRIQFDEPQPVRIGHRGQRAVGALENLSLGGFMCRSILPLAVGDTITCEFRVFGSPLIELLATVTSRVGEGLFGVRFQAGPLSQTLIESSINGAIDKGKATILSIHNLPGGKVMRVAGGLTAASLNEFMHGVERVGVSEIDLSEVTKIDEAGVSMCAQAVSRFGVRAERRSSCVQAAWR
jgi:hypothetical protein